MTQEERFNAALDSASVWERLITDERFTDELAQIEANADHRTTLQMNRIQEAQNDGCL
ncbi:hypothetical protein J1779_07825 [Rahnella sp. FC061912-K]|jgi:hypothetical protein|uniref:hypothetical protein n=1 Tax=Rahnella rivi TaxID=2816249 RepID=UPI001C25BB2C|nr:hypothetical protein [Rahnella rivi]MBU9829838.1 hypothetical protein [Rahnella rivi]